MDGNHTDIKEPEMHHFDREPRHLAGCCLLLAGLAGSAAPGSAWALANAQINSPWMFPNTLFVSNSTSAILSKDSPGLFSASASTDSRLGTVKAFIDAKTYKDVGGGGTVTYPHYWADTVSGFNDTVHFQNYTPGQVATLYFSIHGSFVENRPEGTQGVTLPTSADANFFVQAYTPGGAINEHWTIEFLAGFSARFPQNRCDFADLCLSDFSNDTLFGKLTLPLTADPYAFRMGLSVSASGYLADFSNTARMYLSVPDGVTFSSDSGSFLSQATPIPAVPEPAGAAMLALGLAAAAGLGRVRSRR